MKIVAVLGSPRPNGNSATLAQKFLDEARSLGAETRSYLLNQMAFQGCQSCRACKTKSEVCILEDDLSEVLEAIKEADILVLASPVYFGDLSGQLKCFVDRTYSYANPDFSSRVPPGKQAIMVLVQANPDLFGFDDIFPRYQRFLKMFGFHPVHLLRAVGLREPEDLDQHPEFLEQAAALAREVVRRAQGRAPSMPC
jgi:NAD(P)H-dependent FMN reductase